MFKKCIALQSALLSICIFCLCNFSSFPHAAAEEAQTPVSIFSDISGEEITVSSEDGVALHLGTRFASKVSGKITKVRMYTSAAENGIYIVSLWSVADSTLLETYEWKIETGIDGWQEFALPEAFAVESSTDYILSIKNNDQSQHYSFIKNYFRNTDFSDTLFILQNDSGIFTTADDTMPANTNTVSNPAFLRDIVFIPDALEPAPLQNEKWKEAQSIFVSDLSLGGSYSYGSALQVDMATDFEYLSIGADGGAEYDKGFAMYASSKEGDAYVEINIEGLGMKTFASYVGIAYTFGVNTTEGTAVFIVEADGKEVVRSNICTYTDAPALLSADITGAKIRRLSVGNAEDSCSGDLAVWGNPIISKYPTAEEIYTDLPAAATPAATEAPEVTASPKATAAEEATKKQAASPSPATKEKKDRVLGLIYGIAAILVTIAVLSFILIVRKKKKQQEQ